MASSGIPMDKSVFPDLITAFNKKKIRCIHMYFTQPLRKGKEKSATKDEKEIAQKVTASSVEDQIPALSPGERVEEGEGILHKLPFDDKVPAYFLVYVRMTTRAEGSDDDNVVDHPVLIYWCCDTMAVNSKMIASSTFDTVKSFLRKNAGKLSDVSFNDRGDINAENLLDAVRKNTSIVGKVISVEGWKMG